MGKAQERMWKALERIEATQETLILNQEILQVRAINSTLGRKDRIHRVKNKLGRKPPRKTFPYSIQVLIVAGNEYRPGSKYESISSSSSSSSSSSFPALGPISGSESDDNSDDSENEKGRRSLRWNKELSKELLTFYGETYESGPESSGEEITSRSRRLRVAQVLGITRLQLNFSQMKL